MTKDQVRSTEEALSLEQTLRLALEALENITSVSICEATHHAKKDRHLLCEECPNEVRHLKAITAIKAALSGEAQTRSVVKDEPYAFEASMYPRVKIDPVTGNVSIGTVMKACGLECNCTDVCEQETDYKALWQQMCERCDELDNKLAQRKPLTDEEIQQIFIANSVVVDNGNAYMVAGLRALNITRAIEAKLTDKNI